MRAVAMLKGHRLPAHKESLVKLGCRLLVHAENISNRIYFESECREDGEPRVALAKLLDISKEARELLGRAFPNADYSDDNDPLAALLHRGDGQ